MSPDQIDQSTEHDYTAPHTVHRTPAVAPPFQHDRPHHDSNLAQRTFRNEQTPLVAAAPEPDKWDGGEDDAVAPIGDGKGKGRVLSPAKGSVVRLTDPEQAYTLADEDEQPEARSIDASLIAPEILIKVFAFLDPHSLGLAALVCRSWASVARDDATWRSAFATHFNLEADREVNCVIFSGASKAVPSLRRLTGISWRSEFQRRSELHRRWRKSRAPTVLSTPRVDIVNQISVSKKHTFMLSASQVYGVASRSNPFTGKVTKGYLDAEGTANGAGNGNPNIEFSPNVTALAMGADASNIAWGFRSGEVGLTTLSRQGVNPRGAIRSHKLLARGGHVGPVSAVAVPFPCSRDGVHGPGRSPERLRQQLGAMGDVATTFVTAGHDGTVRLWSSLRPMPIWVASTAASSSAVSNGTGRATDVAVATGLTTTAAAAAGAPISALDYDAKAGIIVAGSTNGRVVAWTNLDIAGLLATRPDASDLLQPSAAAAAAGVDAGLIEAQQRLAQLFGAVQSVSIDLSEGSGAETSLDFLRIDADVQGGPSALKALPSFSILAHHSGARVLLRHRVSCIEATNADDVAAGLLSSTPGAGADCVKVSTTVLGAPLTSEITAIKPDFEPRSLHDKRTSVVSSPLVSTAVSPMLAPMRTDSNSSVARLNIGPSPFDVFVPGGRYPERKYVCVGTKAGTVHVFDWEAEGASFDDTAQEEWQGLRPARFIGARQLQPALTLEAHHTTITTLEVTTLHLIAGTSDGTIKVFCALSGDLIRTINNRTATRHPARMLAAGELTDDEAARFRVQQIVADHDTLIAAIGHQILAFRAEPLQRAKDKRLAAAAKKTGKALSRTADSKFQMQIDLRRDLRESQAQLQAEREERQAQHGKRKEAVIDHGLGDMTEQEAFEYAMMLSKDEEAKAKVASQLTAPPACSRARDSGSASFALSSRAVLSSGLSPANDPELVDALEQIALAESRQQSKAPSRCSSTPSWSLEDRYALGDFDMDDMVDDDRADGDGDGDATHDSEDYYVRTSASPSPSPHASPHMGGVGSPSRAWTIMGQAGPSARSNALDRSHPESKIRTMNASRPVNNSWLSSVSLSPTAAAMQGPRPAFPEEWPAMSPPTASLAQSPHSQTYGRSLSSTASSWRGASPLDGAYSSPSAGGAAGNGEGKKKNLGAWASGNPSLRPQHTRGGDARQQRGQDESLLAAQLGRGAARRQGGEHDEEEMDADLRFAIELSLAEERSRSEREAANRS